MYHNKFEFTIININKVSILVYLYCHVIVVNVVDVCQLNNFYAYVNVMVLICAYIMF